MLGNKVAVFSNSYVVSTSEFLDFFFGSLSLSIFFRFSVLLLNVGREDEKREVRVNLGIKQGHSKIK
jgi:hypothetical protein